MFKKWLNNLMHWNINTNFDLLSVPRPFPPKNDLDFDILIGIKSEQPDFNVRKKIRNTWANTENWNILRIEYQENVSF